MVAEPTRAALAFWAGAAAGRAPALPTGAALVAATLRVGGLAAGLAAGLAVGLAALAPFTETLRPAATFFAAVLPAALAGFLCAAAFVGLAVFLPVAFFAPDVFTEALDFVAIDQPFGPGHCIAVRDPTRIARSAFISLD
ncbi:MAG TPA: hypothetical protein VEK74_02005 [Burkholderiaceae bacterium]|nr:hypothetical protein [Burkholderiaceae bacterium]